MQVETQVNMKSQATGVRKTSDGIDSEPNKKSKRIKLSHHSTDDLDQNNLSGEANENGDNSTHSENVTDIHRSTISEQSVQYEGHEKVQLNDPYINGSLNNGDRSSYEENVNNGFNEEPTCPSIGEDNYTEMDTCETQYLPPPTLEMQCVDSFDHYSSNTSEASEKDPDSLKDLDETCQINLNSTPQNVQQGVDNSEMSNIPQIACCENGYENTSNEAALKNSQQSEEQEDTYRIPKISQTLEYKEETYKISKISHSSEHQEGTYEISKISQSSEYRENSFNEIPKPSELHKEESTSDIPEISQTSAHLEVSSVSSALENNISLSSEATHTMRNVDIKYLGIYDFQTTHLEGHADVIFSVAVNEDVVLSSSGDTTVKVWSVEEKRELSNLAGHTDAVTAILLLDSTQSKTLGEKLGFTDVSSIAVSASMDCHIKVWSVSDAKELTSIYTFNGITSMDYCHTDFCAIIGTEGGKLEAWDLSDGQKLDSVLAHESSISRVKVKDNYVYTTSADGAVKVSLFEENELQPLYSRKRRESTSDGVDLGPTHWKTAAVNNDIIFLGDNTSCLKVLNWRLGRLRLLINQIEKNGVCDAILAEDNILLSTTYNPRIDTAGINVWSLPDMTYIGTLSGDVQDIYCLAMTHFDNKLRIVSGGHQLIVWDFNFKAPSKTSSNSSFSFCEIEGIGVEVNEKPVQSPIRNIAVSPAKVNDIKEKESRCNIL